MTLKAFANEVNRIKHAECARINADPKKIFGAEHYDYPESMMKLYFDQGLTPKGAVELMDDEHEAEGWAEAAAS
jgi:hypothetical protein